jgi:hypothetical protein
VEAEQESPKGKSSVSSAMPVSQKLLQRVSEI